MDVIHFHSVAEERCLRPSVSSCQLSDGTAHRTPPRPRHAGQPVEEMQPCFCPDIFGHGALQMAGKLRDKGFGCHAVAARGETG